MSDMTLVREQLESVLEALERIPRRFASIYSPEDFTHLRKAKIVWTRFA